MPRKKPGAREEIERMKPDRAPLSGPTGLEHTLSPVDLPPSGVALPQPLRWTSTVIATATLFLALFNAHAIRSWSYELRSNPAAERVVGAAEGWYAATAAAGLNRPVETMRGWWQAAKEIRFTREPPPAPAGEPPPQR